MRTKLLKCGICSNWHNRFHCPTCAATRVQVARSQYEYYDAHNGKQIVRGSDLRKFPILSIAQILSEDYKQPRT